MKGPTPKKGSAPVKKVAGKSASAAKGKPTAPKAASRPAGKKK